MRDPKRALITTGIAINLPVFRCPVCKSPLRMDRAGGRSPFKCDVCGLNECQVPSVAVIVKN